MRWRRRNNAHAGIDFDEILMDSHNIPSFDTQQFEGRIEQTISRRAIWLIGAFFVLAMLVFLWQLQTLQLKKGNAYFALSEKNSLDDEIIFADRGVIYDRNGVELAWNERTPEMEAFDYSHRAYIAVPGHAILLGYIKYPQKDKKGFYWQTHFEGAAGIEKSQDKILNGENGSKIIEVSATGDVFSENIINEPEHGTNLYLTIDSRLQSQMYESIKKLSDDIGYQGGAGAIMDIKTGELIVATSYPEYSPQALSDGTDKALVNSYLNDPKKPFLNRLVSGLYSPGSTVKPYIALAALYEGIITPNTTIMSTGQIEVPNPYDPEKPTIFRDWKEGGHGATNVTKALAESVNTFFYAIGGGYKGQAGLGISKIESYVKLFGIDEKTGVDIAAEASGTVPSPDWKKKIFKDATWRLGDTYNTSIGQYGFQVTPIEMLRAVSGMASSGTLVTPHVVGTNVSATSHVPKDFSENDFRTVREGMRSVVTEGTGGVLNVPYVHIAAKTGSAQTGFQNKFINSWVTGFFPYENPKYAFVVLMEKGPSEGERSASFAARGFFDWMRDNTPEYFTDEEIPSEKGPQ